MNQEHDEILRMMLRAIAAKMVGDIDRFASKHISRSLVLAMPNYKALSVLGKEAEHFSDNGTIPDGTMPIQAAHWFSRDQIISAMNAGGDLVSGYKFEYPARVTREHTNLPGWCGYHSTGFGFATSFETALIVCAISLREKEQLNDNHTS